MIREYCECHTSTRPKPTPEGICPKCGLPRHLRRKPIRRAGRERQYEKIARYVYETERDVDLPDEGPERDTP